MAIFGEIFSTIFGAIAAPIKDWSARKTLEAETKAKVAIIRAEAEIKREERLAQTEADWDTEAMRQTEHSWKDEWFTILLSLPFIASFIPEVQEYTLKGWQYLAKAPEWYTYSFLGAICASFGLRWAMKGFFTKS